MLMGARTYLPSLGMFTSTDPIPGGNVTAYAYPVDPIGQVDLNGRKGVLRRLRHAASQFISGVGWVAAGQGAALTFAHEMAKPRYAIGRAVRSPNVGRLVSKSAFLRSAARAGRAGTGLLGGALVVVGAVLTYGADVADGHSQAYAIGHAVVTTAFSVGFGIAGAAIAGPVGAVIGGFVGGLIGEAAFGFAAKLWNWN